MVRFKLAKKSRNIVKLILFMLILSKLFYELCAEFYISLIKFSKSSSLFIL